MWKWRWKGAVQLEHPLDELASSSAEGETQSDDLLIAFP